jgi:hypothetical protein
MIAALELTTEPFSQPLDDESSVSAVGSFEPRGDRWHVTVVVVRPPDRPPVRGEELDARLFDDRGAPLTLVRRPTGPLVEAGGSLGMSANAPFEFEASGGRPSRLDVNYRSRTVSFRLVPRERDRTP